MLVDDQENTVKRTNRVHQQPFIPYKKTSKSYGKLWKETWKRQILTES